MRSIAYGDTNSQESILPDALAKSPGHDICLSLVTEGKERGKIYTAESGFDIDLFGWRFSSIWRILVI